MNEQPTRTRKYKSEVTLRYKGKDYTFLYYHIYKEQNTNAVYFNWTEGNFSCDCNRSDFIVQYCCSSFPELECGSTIELVSLKAVGVGVVDGSIAPKELLA